MIPCTWLADQGTVIRNKERGSRLDCAWAVTWAEVEDSGCEQAPLDWTGSVHLWGFQNRQRQKTGKAARSFHCACCHMHSMRWFVTVLVLPQPSTLLLLKFHCQTTPRCCLALTKTTPVAWLVEIPRGCRHPEGGRRVPPEDFRSMMVEDFDGKTCHLIVNNG